MFFESKFNLIQIGNFIFNILEIKGHPIKWETIIASHALNAESGPGKRISMQAFNWHFYGCYPGSNFTGK